MTHSYILRIDVITHIFAQTGKCHDHTSTSDIIDYRNWPRYGLHWSGWQCIIALWWWFCPCRVGGAVWNHTAWLFPLMPLPTLSLFYSYFLFGIEYRKTSLEKILGIFSFVSIYYHWNWFEDLHHVQDIEIKDDSEMLHSQYLRENNGTTCHHGHPADCQLALTNVVEVQTKVVTND